MGIFSREKSSREGYEAEEGRKKEVERDLNGLRWSRPRNELEARYQREQIITDRAILHRIDEKLEKLRATGQKEAIKLNEEYDRLLDAAAKAAQAIANFEREKLGMHDKKDE